MLIGSIDGPALFVIRGRPIRIGGWALLPGDLVKKVDILFDNKLVGVADYGRPRPEIGLNYPENEQSAFCGFRMVLSSAEHIHGQSLTLNARVYGGKSDHFLNCRTVRVFDTLAEARLALAESYASNWQAWLDVANEYRAADEHHEATAVLEAALAHWPRVARLIINFSELAVRTGRTEAAQQHLVDGLPFASRTEATVMRTRISQLEYLTRLEGLGIGESIATGAEPDDHAITTQKIFGDFESLGFNCEFGLAQRYYNVEPLGLLRFALAPLDRLLAALHAGFDGVGHPQNTEMRPVWKTEYGVSDKRYNFLTHTETHQDSETSFEQVFATQCQRMRFLARKLHNDLRSAEKIFLYQRYDRLADDEILVLSDAINRFGKNRLLCVRLAEGGHPAGSVESLRHDVVIGYIAQFSRPQNVAEYVTPSAWLAVCTAALELFDRQSKQTDFFTATHATEAATRQEITPARRHLDDLIMQAPSAYRIITSCYGELFWSAVPLWCRHIMALDNVPIEIMSLDGSQFSLPGDQVSTIQTANEAPPESLAGGGCGDLARLEHIVARLRTGIACFQIDIDVRLKKSILPLARLPFDFLISRAFAFPPPARERLGFVACTGFYLAKPSSLPLCQELLARVRTRRHGTAWDQQALNYMLVECADRGCWTTQTHNLNGVEAVIDAFTVDGCRIGVLPAQAILRNANVTAAQFGNHDPSIVKMFLK
jgi:hypothetical protein